MAKILIAGSTGFIGRRLVYKLLEEGHEVYALSRIRGVKLNSSRSKSLHHLYGDLTSINTIDNFPEQIDAAYYLVHSMGEKLKDLADSEKQTALNFLELIEKTSCKQIIFLSGLIEEEKGLSPHLTARLTVEKTLQKSKIPCTILRASIVIGSGSASFEIIRDLVEKVSIMTAPSWVNNLCQPIAVRDVLFYLSAVLLKKECFDKTYDIGGPEVLSFKEILLRYAKFRGLTRFIFVIPFLTAKISSYWFVFISSVRFSICSYLVESMKQNSRKLNHSIDEVLPHTCLKYEEALDLAFQKIAQNEVVSTWMDSWDIRLPNSDIDDVIQVPQEGCLNDLQIAPITIPLNEVKKRIFSIGGQTGWYSMNWAWKLRGLIDKCVGGAGLNRGRRDPDKVVPGDSIDFWRVLYVDEEKGQLILYAQMRLPGEAWLEFRIDTEKKLLLQQATFRPKGYWGRIYWYSCLPFHLIIFRQMSRAIAQKLSV